MKIGQMSTQIITNISRLFLPLVWRLETGNKYQALLWFRYNGIKMRPGKFYLKIFIFDCWVYTFRKVKNDKFIINGFWFF